MDRAVRPSESPGKAVAPGAAVLWWSWACAACFPVLGILEILMLSWLPELGHSAVGWGYASPVFTSGTYLLILFALCVGALLAIVHLAIATRSCAAAVYGLLALTANAAVFLYLFTPQT